LRPILYYSDDYFVDIGAHVFPMLKFRLIKERLLEIGAATEADFVEPETATDDDAHLVHSRAYIDKLREGTLSQFEIDKIELPYSHELVNASFLGAGGTIAAVRSSVERGVGVNVAGGFHHSFSDHGEGFCVLNDVAMGVARALNDGLAKRVGVIDCDVHQGNGTAAIFADDDRVFTFSIHQEFNYPFVKPPSSLDIGLPDGAVGASYLPRLKEGVEAVHASGAELILYVAGADSYEGDLLGGLSLSKDVLSERDRIVMESCTSRGVPFTVTLAGGYAAEATDTVEIQAATIARAVEVGEALS
jgi:acetoin utilization deacetylase AcuC-like enzyme